MRIYIAASWKHQHAVEMLTEKLEKAAVGNDSAYIAANNAAFIAAAEGLLSNIAAFLQTVPEAEAPAKPEKESPGPEIIAALRGAVERYDMAALHEAIESLDAYTYRSAPDFAVWLREQAGKSDFAAIQKRLET